MPTGDKRQKKTAAMDAEQIGELAANMPVVYKILNEQDENIYTGSAKRGRVSERIAEHLPGGPDSIPGGVKVKIEQKPTIAQAQESEARVIKQAKPRRVLPR